MTDNPTASIIYVILAAVAVLVALSLYRRGRNATAILIGPDDIELQDAEARARAGLAEFLHRFAAPQPGDSDFMVKVRLFGGPEPEQIWAEQLVRRDGQLFGSLANDPMTAGYKFGQSVPIDEANITDWGYRAKGTMQGHFSTRIFLDRMPQRVQADVRQQFGW